MNSLVCLPQTPTPLAMLQARFCLMNLGGEVRVVDREQVASVLSGSGSAEVCFYKKVDGELLMKRMLENLPVPSDVRKTVADFWINPGTHVYDRIAFTPNPTPATTLNYWTETTVMPNAGNWSSIECFIRNIVCDGDAAVFEYLIRYLAHMLQHPEEKPGIIIVLLGLQGTGKGAFFTLLRRIWERTTLFVSDIENVIGHFNAALERHYVVCMDEALFTGDKKALERLKSLITEPICRIEQKYQPARTIESFHRFFAASNSDHFAHVDRDDRRFLFARVSSSRQCDSQYFSQLHKQMDDADAIAAMVHDLLQIDLTGFEVRSRPKTSEHLSQKLQSLTGLERFWYEVLQSGDLYGIQVGLGFSDWDTSQFVPTRQLIDAYKAHDKNAERFRPIQAHVIAASLTKLCPSAKPERTKANHGQQVRGYRLPPLQVARCEFEAAIGGKLIWDTSEPQRQRQATTIFTDAQLEAMWETYQLDDAVLPMTPDVAEGSGTLIVSTGAGFKAVASVASIF